MAIWWFHVTTIQLEKYTFVRNKSLWKTVWVLDWFSLTVVAALTVWGLRYLPEIVCYHVQQHETCCHLACLCSTKCVPQNFEMRYHSSKCKKCRQQTVGHAGLQSVTFKCVCLVMTMELRHLWPVAISQCIFSPSICIKVSVFVTAVLTTCFDLGGRPGLNVVRTKPKKSAK